ncbi:MAG: TIGR04076 family protein [Anaerostipes hadrus]
MKRCKITAIRKTEYKDLMEKYENPMENACDIEEGQVFIAEGWKRPEGFCESAWESISPFVMTLVYGGSDIYEGWMKNKKSAMISCNDGFRPVSFYIEVLEDENFFRFVVHVLSFLFLFFRFCSLFFVLFLFLLYAW